MPIFFRRDATYVAFATVSLALSVGATLAVFTIVNALWLRPLPIADADRVVVLASIQPNPENWSFPPTPSRQPHQEACAAPTAARTASCWRSN